MRFTIPQLFSCVPPIFRIVVVFARLPLIITAFALLLLLLLLCATDSKKQKQQHQPLPESPSVANDDGHMLTYSMFAEEYMYQNIKNAFHHINV